MLFGSAADAVARNGSTFAVRSLQDRIDAEAEQLLETKWQSSLPFDVKPASFSNFAPSSALPPEKHNNILDFTKLLHKNQKVYFCSQTYAVRDDDALDNLVMDLKKAARQHGGVDLVAGGGITKKQQNSYDGRRVYSLVCNCGLIFQNESKKLDKGTGEVTALDGYRKTELHNDRKNNRQGGKHGKHKTGTKRRFTKDERKCPFSLHIYRDVHGLYLKGGMGNPNHQYHKQPDLKRDIKVKATLLSDEEKKALRDEDKAHTGKGVSRNLYYIRNGTFLSRDSIRSAIRKENTESGCDSLEEFFKEEKADVCFLYHKNTTQVKAMATNEVAATSIVPASKSTTIGAMRKEALESEVMAAVIVTAETSIGKSTKLLEVCKARYADAVF